MKRKKIAPKPPIEISHNNFIGVKWDEPSLEVLKLVARGLTNLTELFKSQNVEIKSLLSIEATK